MTELKIQILWNDSLATLGLIWTACWFYFVTESPATHPTISNEEVTYIEANLFHPVSRV
jgi:hypothetical protein